MAAERKFSVRNPFPKNSRIADWINPTSVSTFLGIALTIIFGAIPLWRDDQVKVFPYLLLCSATVNIVLALSTFGSIATISSLRKRPTKDDIFRTSTRFAALINHQTHVEDDVVKCVRHMFYHIVNPGKYTMEPAWTKYYSGLKYEQLENFILQICETAAAIISNHHGGIPGDVSVNIKFFDVRLGPGGKEEVVYFVKRRSSGSNMNRDKSDAETRRKEFLVHENMIYSGLLGSNSIDIYDGVCIIDDIEEYIKKRQFLNETRAQSGLPSFKEPSNKALPLYTSCMVVPISGMKLSVPEILDTERTEKWKAVDVGDDNHAIGTICIDSKKEAYFDRENDIQIMKQLALQAFSGIRALIEVSVLKDAVSGRANKIQQPNI